MVTRAKLFQWLCVCLSLLFITAPPQSVQGQDSIDSETEESTESSPTSLSSQTFLPLVQGEATVTTSVDVDMADEETTSVDDSASVQSAVAGGPVWTSVAAACVPDEGSAGRYEANAARFRHRGTNTGDIYARCNVTNPRDDGGNPAWNILQIVLTDPAGVNQVTAELVRVSNANGGVFTLATVDSNNWVANPATQLRSSIPFAVVYDFDTYSYYVQIKVSRANAASVPDVALVRLT
jgi:hypothetical protein